MHLFNLALATGLQKGDIFTLLSDLSLEFFARLFKPFNLFDHDLLVGLTQLALETVVLFELWVLILYIAELTDTIRLKTLGFVLDRAVAAARASTGTAVVAEGREPERFVTELAVVFVLFLLFFG